MGAKQRQRNNAASLHMWTFCKNSNKAGMQAPCSAGRLSTVFLQQVAAFLPLDTSNCGRWPSNRIFHFFSQKNGFNRVSSIYSKTHSVTLRF